MRSTPEEQRLHDDRQHAGEQWPHIDEPAAHYDRITDAESFERRGRQHARAHWTRQFDVVSDFNIIDDGLQNLVNVAFRS